jgi:hypothetical protein
MGCLSLRNFRTTLPPEAQPALVDGRFVAFSFVLVQFFSVC